MTRFYFIDGRYHQVIRSTFPSRARSSSALDVAQYSRRIR